MFDATIIWDDEPGGNIEHIAEHDLTPDEVDSVLRNDEYQVRFSHSSNLPCKLGWTMTGRYIFVAWVEEIDDPLVIYPVTAYEPTGE